MRLPKLNLVLLLLLQSSQVASFTSIEKQTTRLLQRRQSSTSSQLLVFKKSETPESLEKFSVPSARGSNKSKVRKPAKDNDGKPGAWDAFKATIYGTVDSVESISGKLRGGKDDLGVQEGYAVKAIEIQSNNDKLSPGQLLMNEYRGRSNNPTTPNIESRASAFDSFKATVYGTVDTISSFTTDKDKPEEYFESFKPLTQSTIASSDIQDALPDLQSKNPIKRKIAEGKIKKWEEQEKRRQRAQEREEAARKFKESVYKVGDSISWSVETLASVPSKVSYAAEETEKVAKGVKKSVDEIPGRVDNVVQTVASIPDQVRTKSEEVQASFRTGVENTQKTIQDIQAIPSKIENSIKNTQEKVKATKEAFDDTTNKVKVFAGLEKPKPKPPKTPPPPPPTAKDVGLKVAGSVVSGTAKAAWWVSKGVAGVAWNGATAAYKNATEKKEEKVSSPAKTTKAPEVGVKVVEPATNLSSATKGTADQQQKKTQESIETKESPKASGEAKSEKTKDERSKSASASATSRDTSDVDKEVEEALRQAESALNFADEEESSKRPDRTKEDDEGREEKQ